MIRFSFLCIALFFAGMAVTQALVPSAKGHAPTLPAPQVREAVEHIDAAQLEQAAIWKAALEEGERALPKQVAETMGRKR